MAEVSREVVSYAAFVEETEEIDQIPPIIQ